MRKFYLLTALILFIFSLFWGLSRYENSTRVPNKEKKLQFYSPQTNDHLQSTMVEAIKNAKKSIWIRIYGMTDKKVIEAINNQADKEIDIHITYDPKASKSLPKRLGEKVQHTPYKGSGIGHQKLCVIDEEFVWFGSTNFTGKSLLMHDNLLIGLCDPGLAKHILSQEFGNYTAYTSKDYQFFMLPSSSCLETLITHISEAKESLKIAMFTWTHHKILNAVLEARSRGVTVEVILDQSAPQGASGKIYQRLMDAKVPLHIQKGLPLMHHKLLLIDNKYIATGSTNWTKSAFQKNNETLFFYPLKTKDEQKYFDRLWKALWNDTFPP